jgi:hypothetical protein
MRIQPASFFAFTFVILMAPDFSRAQQTTVPFTETNLPAPMNWSAEQDHQNMMEQLGIKTLRPGANGLNR